MQIHEGGNLYGFCPAKASWDPEVRAVYGILSITAETGQLLEAGGLVSQPDWFVELLGWFLPRFQMHKFVRMAEMVFGSGKK